MLVLKHAYGWVRRKLLGDDPKPPEKKEYPFRCRHCQEYNKAYSLPPVEEIDRKLLVACAKCGKQNCLTLPMEKLEKSANEEKP